MGYSFCIVATFNHFQNALVFKYQLLFTAVFWIEQVFFVCRNVFPMFQAILFFDLKLVFCMGYSLCIVGFFRHFQNALIFQILPVFRAVFCIEQLECACRNVFLMSQAIFFLTRSEYFAWGIAFALWPFLAIFKMLSFFEH